VAAAAAEMLVTQPVPQAMEELEEAELVVLPETEHQAPLIQEAAVEEEPIHLVLLFTQVAQVVPVLSSSASPITTKPFSLVV